MESNLDFRLMALSYKLRDFLLPRRKILEEVGIERGKVVLDYGCGPGSYLIPLTELE
jgi:ubiquinone/menaquinone biosynthesis C-methylase UbiE